LNDNLPPEVGAPLNLSINAFPPQQSQHNPMRRQIGTSIGIAALLFAIVSTVVIVTYIVRRPTLEEASVTVLDIAPMTWDVIDSSIISGPLVPPTSWIIDLDPSPGRALAREEAIAAAQESLQEFVALAEAEGWKAQQADMNNFVGYELRRGPIRLEVSNTSRRVLIFIKRSYTPLLQQLALVAASSLVIGAGVGRASWRRNLPTP
jgi:hypothetical protein